MFWSNWRKERKKGKRKIEVSIACDEADELYDLINAKYGEEPQKKKGEWRGDTERFMFFSYFQAEALVKHSRALTIWTIVIAISTILLFLSAVMTLVDRLCNS